ncbi:hypothetical protein [Chakrabartyella piscis]|uniref:hypothetical protein n=1 Tax=Chakrabartyella piscis TaxID=2918914 RepID=UPI00295891DC|nr:hypothetical protein [Chakrabartyella piscis]
MTWEIVVGLATLMGLFASVIKPMITLTNAITQLNSNFENLASQFRDFDTENSNSHKRLWTHNEKQDVLLQKQERRIHDLDGL